MNGRVFYQRIIGTMKNLVSKSIPPAYLSGQNIYGGCIESLYNHNGAIAYMMRPLAALFSNEANGILHLPDRLDIIQWSVQGFTKLLPPIAGSCKIYTIKYCLLFFSNKYSKVF